MKSIIQVTIFLVFGFSYSQIIPISQASFENAKFYAFKKDNKTELVGEKNVSAEVIVFTSGINTLFTFESSLLSGPRQMFQIVMSEKTIKGDTAYYSVETYNVLDPELKTVDFLFIYTNNRIIKLHMITSKSSVEFY